jgi:hypothetical protein
MTVIFQLFCVDDLRRLKKEGRDELLKIIHKHLPPQQPASRKSASSRKSEEAPKLTLDVSNKTLLHSGKDTPPEVVARIRKRNEEVSEQLKSPLPEGPSDAPELNLSRELLPQLLAPPKRGPLSATEEEQIRQWAISCEVNHYNFYYPLLKIKEEAYEMFRQRTKQRPQGSDSPYSLFNPHHPLYDLYTDLKLKS